MPKKSLGDILAEILDRFAWGTPSPGVSYLREPDTMTYEQVLGAPPAKTKVYISPEFQPVAPINPKYAKSGQPLTVALAKLKEGK